MNHQRVAFAGQGQRASGGIDQIVMIATRMVDHILAGAAAGPALEADQLSDHFLIIEQLDLTAVDQRQQLNIDRALDRLRDDVADAIAAKRLARPLAAITITRHMTAAVRLDRRGEFCGDLLGRERWFDFAHQARIPTPDFGWRWAIAKLYASAPEPEVSTKA